MSENGRDVMAKAAELFEKGLSVRKVAAELASQNPKLIGCAQSFTAPAPRLRVSHRWIVGQ